MCIRDRDYYPPEMIADQWNEFDKQISNDLTEVENKLSITYENLMENPQTVIAKIFSFLELPAPSLLSDGKNVIVNGRKFELINQNNAAISRLDAKTQKELQNRMDKVLEKYNYAADL